MELLRKQIVAWTSGQPPWQQDLLRRVARGRLDDAGRAEVAEIVLGAPGVPAPEPLREEHLPGDDVPESPVSLVAIRDVHGVNALADDQNLRFETSGLTVVYGNNGSGKSGFGRILRVVCRAVAVPNVLADAFGAAGGQRQSARLRLRRSDREEDLVADLDADTPTWLSQMKVFDGECAIEYVRSGNAVEHTPEPLGVLGRCADEQGLVADLLRQWSAAIATPVEVAAATDVEAVLADAELSAEELRDLEGREAQLATLAREDIEAVVTEARAASAGAAALADRVAAVAEGLSETAAVQLEALRAEQTAAVSALEEMRRETLDGQPVAGTGTPTWRTMWEAAREFVAGDFPPSAGDSCPLCQRALDAETEQRMVAFEAFVRGKVDARVERAARDVRVAIDALPEAERLLVTENKAIGTLESDLREAAVQAIRALEARRTALADGEPTSVVGVEDVLRQLRARALMQGTRAQEHEALRGPAGREALTERVAALQKRRELAGAAAAMREKHALLVAARQLDTAGITRKHNDLAKLAISDRLVTAVERELQRLGAGLATRVEAAATGTKGRTVLRVRLKGSATKPGLVLSEGEHRAVALAFFLAQVAESGGTSAIVFDDPVSSLDHWFREEIAQRLAGEAATRQVIVFTHDLAFLSQLSAAARDADVAFAQRHVLRRGERAGIVTDEPPLRQVALAKRAEHLRRQVDEQLTPLWEHNREVYEDRAEKWTTDLRKSWEMLVEDGLLRGVVRRYDPRVYTSKLKELDIPEGAIAKITAAFGKLSAKAHHEAPGATGTPSPERLLEFLGEFEQMVTELGLSDGRDTGERSGEVAA